MPSLDVVGSNNALTADGKTSPTLGGASDSTAPTEGVFVIRDTPALASPPSCDEMMEILKCISRSIDANMPSSRMFETMEVVIPCCFFFLLSKSMYMPLSRYLTLLLFIFCCN